MSTSRVCVTTSTNHLAEPFSSAFFSGTSETGWHLGPGETGFDTVRQSLPAYRRVPNRELQEL